LVGHNHADDEVARIKNGYVTVTRVAVEGAIGTVVYGGVVYSVYVVSSGK